MKTKLCMAVLCAIVAVSSIGCSTTQVIGNSKLNREQLATIEVSTKNGSGLGTRLSQIRQVDRNAVEDGTDYVNVEPGIHTLYFELIEVIDAGGGLSLSLNVLGNEKEVIKPRTASAISSARLIDIRGNFEAGKSYYIDTSSLSFRAMPLTESQQRIKQIMGDLFQDSYLLTGSAVIRETK